MGKFASIDLWEVAYIRLFFVEIQHVYVYSVQKIYIILFYKLKTYTYTK